ncbi:hypothetical protein [Vibrio splendidus]
MANGAIFLHNCLATTSTSDDVAR